MANFGQSQSRARDGLLAAAPRLYKFALAVTANPDLAQALLRGALKSLQNRRDWREDDRDHLTEAFRRIYALWNAKLAEDPKLQKKYVPDARLFSASLLKGSLAGNAHFAKFISSLPSQQRAALYLVYGEAASYDEAADAVGLEVLALMKCLARGHVALSHWLDTRGLSDGPRERGLEIDPSIIRERAA
ncbi:hypothetical protein [Rhodomicrobium lacus]|uniref:hypothetical protein n=1 Tax=Rhodomicrobium lacus TaxID=2498452 RepID=UPI0026E1E253|nr:hypothetical protein [Rhodomicrobium lacus]WKW51328.1 hypothetical protein QMO75_02205 [Rhodomicrobium lacus]